jgi:DNA-binding MarR family transcriptional regulator
MDAAAPRIQPAQPDQPDLGILLAAAYQEFVARLHGHLAEQGYADLGSSDGFVFRALAGQPMTVSELAARLEISKQGAGQIIDDMERRGYVVRSAHPDDARARLVDLAPRGRGALAAARAFHRDREERLLARHGHRAVAAARTALTDLAGPRAEGDDPRLRAGLV